MTRCADGVRQGVSRELRSRTASCHLEVEAAYDRFDLGDPASYAGFLQAHARALGAAEGALAGTPGLPTWRPRASLLRDDLGALDIAVPDPLPFPAVQDAATGWGVLYVLEGSRIGSGLLSRRLPPGQPHRYLSATHGPGEWPHFRTRLDNGPAARDANKLEQAVAGATACFKLFAAAGAAGRP